MTELYILTNRYGQYLGVFTTPEKAIEHAYWNEVYQVCRGYRRDFRKIYWDNSSKWHWYGYDSLAELHKPGFSRGERVYEIHYSTLDWMGPLDEDMKQTCAGGLPSFDEFLHVEMQ